MRYQAIKWMALLLLAQPAKTQNVGIGTIIPLQKLDVDGAVRVGETISASTGSIRWNATKNDFEGYNGVAWVSLTGGKGKWGNQTDYATENSATQFKMLTSTVPGSEFGSAIAAENDWMIAGAYRDGVPNYSTKWAAGSIHLYHADAQGQWSELFSAYDPDAKTNDFFGQSVDLSATHVIAGAPNADNLVSEDIGKVYVYTYTNSAMTYQATLLASDGQPGDHFGFAVGIHGDLAIVGAPQNDVNGTNNMGSVYVYNRTGNTWSLSTTLTPADGQAEDQYGSFVGLWNDYIVVSTPFKTVNNIPYAGKVYVYKKTGSGWILISQLLSPDPSPFEMFGYRVTIQDNYLLVGAPHAGSTPDDGNGSLYVYALNNFIITPEATLTASDGKPSDAFGVSSSFHNNVILVSAPFAPVGASAEQGKAYLFRKAGGVWKEEALLTSSTAEAKIRFGFSTALVSSTALIGAPWAAVDDRPDNGQILFFRRY